MLIGLHGRLRSGKDTACGFILDWAHEQGREAKREAFADRLKLSAARALGFDQPDDEAIELMNALKETGAIEVWMSGHVPQVITGRKYLQLYGTEAHREIFDTDFWVNAVLPRSAGGEFDGILVITDVRFPNEAERIRDLGGEVWEIVRDTGRDQDSHASEVRLPEEMIDLKIDNNKSLDHLRDVVTSLMERKVYV